MTFEWADILLTAFVCFCLGMVFGYILLRLLDE